MSTKTSPPDMVDNTQVISDNYSKLNKYPDNVNYNKDRENYKSTWHWFQVSSVCIIKLTIFLIAIYLSWNCNKNESMLVRILISTIAGIFSEFYIIYYSIYRIYLGNKCPI